MASAAVAQPMAVRASMGASGASPSSYHCATPLLTADASACVLPPPPDATWALAWPACTAERLWPCRCHACRSPACPGAAARAGGGAAAGALPAQRAHAGCG